MNSTTSDSTTLAPLVRFSETANYVLFATAAIIISVGIVGNLGVLLVVIRVPDMRSPMYLCLSSLSLSDLLVLVALPIIPLSRLLRDPPIVLGKAYCYLTALFDRGSVVCSILTVLLISLERFVVIHYPLRATLLITGRRTLVSLVTIWVLAYGVTGALVDMAYYRLHTGNESTFEDCSLFADGWHDAYLTAITSLLFFLPLVVVIILNASIVHKVLAEPPSDNGSGTANMRRARRQAVFMIVVVVILFTVCIAPFQTVVLVEIYGHDLMAPLSEPDWQVIIWASRIMAYINSAANPVIYNVMSSKFRSAMVKSLVYCKHKSVPTERKTVTFMTNGM